MSASIVSPPMARKAATLAELLPTLSRGRSKRDGTPFYIVPSSTRLSAHWTALDGSGCTCIGYQRRGLCTHAIAALAIHERQAAISPTPWRPCQRGCGELLAPTHLGKSCDPCWAKLSAKLDCLEG